MWKCKKSARGWDPTGSQSKQARTGTLVEENVLNSQPRTENVHVAYPDTALTPGPGPKVHIHKAPYGRAGVVRTTNVLSWAGVGAQISPGWLAQHDAPLCRVLTTRFHEAGEPVA